ncbi:hypothetical protein POJ06DRAFT_3297 [Lipomyces tetrasporus]|uniref:DUS-like FMN-binding domain-containing protein n=1 Tax=Lipomyces tetrasporus TaxID=54092 RepID=A0AAD7R0T0_9ASCO|nr:uncharacterized protein POJ06DRAFT_3297 [Lipomyces tetrasporus]KAJ8103547.1 hypothetical protein POJ06DRAFT_3297 [Lipomyces tetrasporus]
MPPLNYSGKLVLAPMVRTGELPLRLSALRYGADLVWSPEIVDKKIIGCKRIANEKINCIDFVLPDKDNNVVFRTHRDLERNKIVFQLGTASPELAVQAATVVAADVAGIDVNSGCPKHFSIHSGMGAALLRTPDKLVAILEALVKEVGKKFDIGISVKIRILDTPEETLVLVKRLVKTGISALTVHCRKIPMRPRERAVRDGYLAGIASICRESGVTCIANGDVYCRGDLDMLKIAYGVDSAMIATSAEANVSCFSADAKNAVRPWREVAEEIFNTAIEVDNHTTNTKYVLGRIIPGKDAMYRGIMQSHSHDEMKRVFHGLPPRETELVKAQKPAKASSSHGQSLTLELLSNPKRKLGISEMEELKLETDHQRQKFDVNAPLCDGPSALRTVG